MSSNFNILNFSGYGRNSATSTNSAAHHHSSSWASTSAYHNPLLGLSSHCILQAFGPTVQRVADTLSRRSSTGLTLPQIVRAMQKQRRINDESSHRGVVGLKGFGGINGDRFRERDDEKEDIAHIRASLLVLMQHDVVTFRKVKRQRHDDDDDKHTSPQDENDQSVASAYQYYYQYHPEQARRLLRYARFIEFTKKTHDETAAAVFQVLLVAGKLETMDWMVRAVQQQSTATENSTSNGTSGFSDHRRTTRQQVVEVIYRLVKDAYVVEVEPEGEDEYVDDDHEEYEFKDTDAASSDASETEPPPRKKVRIQEARGVSPKLEPDHTLSNAAVVSSSGDDMSMESALLSLIQSNAHYKSTLLTPEGSSSVSRVWKVNITMLTQYLQAYLLGRLVAERYGQRVQSCGSLVTAALKFTAQHVYLRRLKERNGDDVSLPHRARSSFAVMDIVRYIPTPVLQLLERKEGGLEENLNNAFTDLSRFINPCVVTKYTAIPSSATSRKRGNGDDTRYEIDVNSLAWYMQKRVIHQLVHDRHGEVAARIVNILSTTTSDEEEDGESNPRPCWMESEPLADAAMVPAKDTRAILHRLYKSRYIELLQLSTRQQYNPGSTIYLWGVYPDRIRKKIVEDVALALWNIRLRRQHELQVGKEWIERAQQEQQILQNTSSVSGSGENDHEVDRRNYQKFCLGLERLDFAASQLDDTLLVMHDYAPNKTEITETE